MTNHTRKCRIWKLLAFAMQIQDGNMHEHYTMCWLNVPGPHQ